VPPRTFRSGLRIDLGLQFEFKPSLGITARHIDNLGRGIRSFREPLKRSIQQVLAPSFRKNFEAGGRPEQWEPLSEFAVEMRDGSERPILVRSGMLKRTIQQFNIWTVDTEKAAILDLPQKIWYGKIHQGGAVGRARRGAQTETPARPFVLIQEEDFSKIERVFEIWVAERIARSRAFRITGRP
jgi:phage virion morphogenesis protein